MFCYMIILFVMTTICNHVESLEYVILHEIGHVLNFSHVYEDYSVMNPIVYNGIKYQSTCFTDYDISMISNRYNRYYPDGQSYKCINRDGFYSGTMFLIIICISLTTGIFILLKIYEIYIKRRFHRNNTSVNQVT